jgi:hypothetical protein
MPAATKLRLQDCMHSTRTMQQQLLLKRSRPIWRAFCHNTASHRDAWHKQCGRPLTGVCQTFDDCRTTQRCAALAVQHAAAGSPSAVWTHLKMSCLASREDRAQQPLPKGLQAERPDCCLACRQSTYHYSRAVIARL